MTQICLMLGAGLTPPVRVLRLPTSAPDNETKWVTLDINKSGNPDHLFDLGDLEWYIGDDKEINLPGGLYDEIHAYDILEHFGRQGDYIGFFRTFSALHRALVLGGHLIGTTPAYNSLWLFSDPGHRRVITIQTLAFLTKDHYKQLGRTKCTDYREFVDPYWWEIETYESQADVTEFALKAV